MPPHEPYAHSGRNDDRSDWQTLAVHAQGAADLAEMRGAALGLGASARLVTEFHDFGKNDPDFDRVLRGGSVWIIPQPEAACSSTARRSVPSERCWRRPSLAITPAYRIPEVRTRLERRLELFRARDPVPREVTAAARVDFTPVLSELKAKMRNDPVLAGFDLSVAGRMVFSCLVDADYRDTEAFYDQLDLRSRDRDWPS